MRRRPAHAAPRSGGTSRRLGVALGIASVLVLASAGTAFAYWSANGEGPSTTKADTLAPPGTLVVAAVGSTSVSLRWGPPADLPASPGLERDGFWVFRTTSASPFPPGVRLTTTSPALVTAGTADECRASELESASGAMGCTDTTLTPGTTYDYEVEAVYGNWISLPVGDPTVTTPPARTTTTVTTTKATATTTGATTAAGNATTTGAVTATGTMLTVQATVRSPYTAVAPSGTMAFFEEQRTHRTEIGGCTSVALGTTAPYRATCTTTAPASGSTETFDATFTSTSPSFAGSAGSTAPTPARGTAGALGPAGTSGTSGTAGTVTPGGSGPGGPPTTTSVASGTQLGETAPGPAPAVFPTTPPASEGTASSPATTASTPPAGS